MSQLVQLESGKAVLNGTYNPCDLKASNNALRLMKMVGKLTSNRKFEEIIPKTWFCPIKKVILSYSRHSLQISFLFSW